MLRNNIAFLEIFLDTSLYLPSLDKDIGICLLFAEDVAKTHEKQQENMLYDEKDRDKLNLMLLDRGLKAAQHPCWIFDWLIVGIVLVICHLKFTRIKLGQLLENGPWGTCNCSWDSSRDWRTHRRCNVCDNIRNLGISKEEVLSRIVNHGEERDYLMRTEGEEQNILNIRKLTVMIAV